MAQNASSNNQATSSGSPAHAQHVEAFYRVPKMPAFYKTDPALWFIQVEASLGNAGIKSQITMADTVVAHLDIEAVALINDLVESPDPVKQYELIKERIVSTFAVSFAAKLRQLLKGQVTLEGKPSQILARMRNLCGSFCGDSVLRSIFLESLPKPCRAVLVTSKTDNLQDLAQLADTIMDAYGLTPQHSVASLTKVCPSECANINKIAPSSPSSSIKSTLELLLKQLQRLATQDRTRNRYRKGSNNFSRSRSRSRSRPAGGICWIYKKNGVKAIYCVKPCSWKQIADNSSN
ncbi:hypothetical protein PUN28_002098 [Cardiocondyla obscurior]|uniref:DUF7041 domain-containing protein n=1 Tax=Cardiocondyla obscurior TaxID=286306 RepID=A0AAW2GSI8_9HYME